MDHSRFLFIIKGEIADNIHSFQREGRYTRIIYDSGKDYPCLLYTSPSPRDRG